MNKIYNYYQALEKLEDTVYTTRTIRYSSSRRLQKRQELSVFSTAIISIYLLIISIAPKIFSELDSSSDINTFISIVLPIFILLISILESTRNYQKRAESLFDSAMELGRLMNKIKISTLSGGSLEDYRNLVEEYDNCCSKSSNHEPIDYIIYQYENKIRDKNISFVDIFNSKVSSKEEDKKIAFKENMSIIFVNTIRYLYHYLGKLVMRIALFGIYIYVYKLHIFLHIISLLLLFCYFVFSDDLFIRILRDNIIIEAVTKHLGESHAVK